MSFHKYLLLYIAIFLCNYILSAQDNISNNSNISIHRLSTADYNALAGFLSKYTGSILKDTIYIKYDFDNDPCWDSLEKRSSVFIHTIIGAYRNEIKEALVQRPGISIFQFKEKGKSRSKFKKWNTDIITDRNNDISDLLFKRNATCGSSAIVLPGAIFLLIPGDAHFSALKIDQQQIISLLKQ